MKKSLFLLGAAAMIIAGCAKETVTRVADNRAIQFDTHIDNTTKAVTEVSGKLTDTDYFIFGNAGTDGTTYAEQLFNNENAKAVYYWTSGKQYAFGAYADGKGNSLTPDTQVKFTPGTTSKLEFINYKADDLKDLIATVVDKVTPSNLETTPDAVNLTFKHMLSQVKFTFTTTDPTDFTISVKDLQILNAKVQETGTIDNAQKISWTATGTPENIAYDATSKSITSAVPANYDSKMVIPQAGTDALKVEFKASISGKGLNVVDKVMTATLGYSGTTPTTANTWEPGYRYNYTATLTKENIAGAKPIKFTAEVEAWKDATAQDATQTLK